jgi:ATP-binding cassette subfamily C (CFTR/MRP) protein 1
MVTSSSQSILKTGSFSGFRAIKEELGSGYLTAERTRQQPLCGNKEGWGPLSPYRYDFTPCFMDVWVSSVAVFGILAGAIAIWWLVKRKTQAQVDKNWHFWTKQVCVSEVLRVLAMEYKVSEAHTAQH